MTSKHPVAALMIGVALLASACGGGSKATDTPAAQRSATSERAVPNVRGMNSPDAVVRLLGAHYCVRLKAGRRIPVTAKSPVEDQTPAAGTTARAWSTVTLTIGIPTPAGAPASKTFSFGVDAWGGGPTPCPPIGIDSKN